MIWHFFTNKSGNWHENKLITLYQCDFQTKNIKEENMEESLGLGKKSSGPETDTETWSWFRLPIPKQGFGRTLRAGLMIIVEKWSAWFTL